MDRKRILFLLETTNIGGIERQCIGLYNVLKEYHDLHLMVTDVEGVLSEDVKNEPNYSTLTGIGPGAGYPTTPSPAKLKAVRDYIFKNAIDIVHIFNAPQFMTAVPDMLMLFMTLVGDMGRDVYYERIPIKTPRPKAYTLDEQAKRIAEKRATLLKQLGDRRMLLVYTDNPGNVGLLPCKTMLMDNPILAVPRFDDDILDIGARDPNTVIWVGRDSREKHPELFIEVASLIPEVQFIMLLATNGKPMKHTNIPENVRIETDVTDITLIQEYYKDSSVFMLTSDTEGFPLALEEAMSAGCYPIVSKVGNINEHTLPYGTLIEERTPENYAMALLWWFSQSITDQEDVRDLIIDHATKYDMYEIAGQIELNYRSTGTMQFENPFPIRTSTNKRKSSRHKQRKLAIVTKSHHQKILAAQLGVEVIFNNAPAIAKYETVIFMGIYQHEKVEELWKAKKLNPNLKVILWWIGTDVYNAVNKPKYDVQYVNDVADRHLCVSTDLQAELRSIGIRADVLTLTPERLPNPKPLPEQYTVAIYMVLKNEFYMYSEIENIIRKTPDIKYLVYGNKERMSLSKFPNVEMCGWVEDVSDIMERSSCLLRLTEHDGFPKSLIEFASMMRAVICNHHYPKLGCVKNAEEALAELKKQPVLPEEVSDWYRTEYGPGYMHKHFRPLLTFVQPIPKVSVLTYVYCTKKNERLNMLKECIASVRDQNFYSYEHIIVDDGSEIDLASEIENMQDPHLVYFEKEHTGILQSTANWRCVCTLARGEYIIFLGSDDKQLEECLTPLSECLDAHPGWIGVVGTHVRENGKPHPHKFEDMPMQDALMIGNCINGNGFMFRRSAMAGIELPPDWTGYASDYDMWLKLSETGEIGRIDKPVSFYRTHKDSTRKKDGKNKDTRKDILHRIKDSAEKRRRVSA